MDTSREVAATYHVSAATRPGPLATLAEAAQELRSRWRLVRYLTQADLKRKGTDTLFGNIWWVLDPLLQMSVYVILVTIVFQRPTPAYPLFVFAAIVPWKWFGSVVSDSITSVTSQERLIKQIQFPKLVLPASAMLTGLAQFAFGLVPLLAMLLIFYRDRLSVALVYVPLIALVQFVFSAGFGVLLAAFNVFFRDIGNLARHVLRLWFYLSPILYGADTIAELHTKHPTIVALMQLNPFFTILESYRQAFYYGQAPDFAALAIVLAASIVLLVAGLLVFKHLEPAFAKVL